MSPIERNSGHRHHHLATQREVDVVLPRTAEYAVRAVLRVAAGGGAPVRVSDIAAAVDAPRSYLAKTLNALARNGVLFATRGPGGGFRLAVDPDVLTLDRVVQPFASDDRRRCLLRQAPCGVAPYCAAHDRWKPAAWAIDEFFRTTTIADLLAERTAPEVQLSSHS